MSAAKLIDFELKCNAGLTGPLFFIFKLLLVVSFFGFPKNKTPVHSVDFIARWGEMEYHYTVLDSSD